MTDTTLIKVSNVSKRFVMHKEKSLKDRVLNFSASRRHRDDFWALRDIDLDIEAGSTVGLVGHNGSGKSTLLKVLGGIIEPTTGSVARRGRMLSRTHGREWTRTRSPSNSGIETTEIACLRSRGR